jgi:hypothetical protein
MEELIHQTDIDIKFCSVSTTVGVAAFHPSWLRFYPSPAYGIRVSPEFSAVPP